MEFLQLATDVGIAAQAHAANGIVIGQLTSSVTSAAQADAARPSEEAGKRADDNVVDAEFTEVKDKKSA